MGHGLHCCWKMCARTRMVYPVCAVGLIRWRTPLALLIFCMVSKRKTVRTSLNGIIYTFISYKNLTIIDKVPCLATGMTNPGIVRASTVSAAPIVLTESFGIIVLVITTAMITTTTVMKTTTNAKVSKVPGGNGRLEADHQVQV